jgi:serine/threonine-protein phosphatase 2A regulatory subunit B'
MLKHVLMPLHKCTLDNNGFESLDAFEALHPPLLECITSFIERDPPTLKIVVQGLSSAWSHRPHSLLLEELEVVINLSPPNIFRSIASNVLQLLSLAVSDQHFQIAERALLLWRGEYFVSLIAQHRHTALPLLYQPLVQSETKHWHPQVRVLASNVLKLFQSMDEHLFRQQEEELE